jgi:hypothetical protein
LSVSAPLEPRHFAPAPDQSVKRLEIISKSLPRRPAGSFIIT